MRTSATPPWEIPAAVRHALDLMSVTWDLTELAELEHVLADDYGGTGEWPFIWLALCRQRDRIWNGVSRRSPASWTHIAPSMTWRDPWWDDE